MLGIESNQSSASFPVPCACQACREGRRVKNHIKVGAVAQAGNERCDGAWDRAGLPAPGVLGVQFLARTDPRHAQLVLPADAGLRNG